MPPRRPARPICCQVAATEPGIAGEDGDVEPADVDAQLEGVRRDHAEDLAVAQTALDRPALGREVAAAIAADPRARPEVLAECLAQRREHDLDRRPAPSEDHRLAARPQERHRPAVGQRQVGAAGAGGDMGQGWLDQEDVALTATARRCGRRGSASDRSACVASSAGLAIVAEQQTMIGRLP